VTCELAFLGGCSGRIQHHHIINRSRTRGNKAARKFVDDNGWLFYASICDGHNVGRVADGKRVRGYLMLKRWVRQPARVERTLAALRELFRSDASDLTIEGLCGG
jgi:hypothetical protein